MVRTSGLGLKNVTSLCPPYQTQALPSEPHDTVTLTSVSSPGSWPYLRYAHPLTPTLTFHSAPCMRSVGLTPVSQGHH